MVEVDTYQPDSIARPVLVELSQGDLMFGEPLHAKVNGSMSHTMTRMSPKIESLCSIQFRHFLDQDESGGYQEA